MADRLACRALDGAIMSAKAFAQDYIDRGWSPVPIKPRSKEPRHADWKTRAFTAADFNDDDNIGLHLGKGLYDWDLDCQEAVTAADIILNTGSVFGRPGKPRSHRLFTCTESIPLTQRKDVHGKMIVELRGLDGGGPTQTVAPPSTHVSGEPIAWDHDGHPLAVAPSPALLNTNLIAISVVLARALPNGGLHDIALALGGFFHRAGLPTHAINLIIKATWTIIGRPSDHTQNGLQAVAASVHKLLADPDAKVTGGPKLAQVLHDGDKVMRLINQWLGRTEQASRDEIIEKLNAKHFIVTVGKDVVVADDSDPDRLRLFPFSEFKKLYIKERLPGHTTKHGKFVKGEPIADFWLEHPDGRKHDSLVYVPGLYGRSAKRQEVDSIIVSPSDYNGWRGFRVQSGQGPDPHVHYWERILYHLRHVICGMRHPDLLDPRERLRNPPDDRLFRWLMNWCAALVQRPGVPAQTALLLMGGQGIGKGLLAEDLLGSFFDQRHFVHIINREHFYGRFNDVLSGRVLVFLDESTWGGDKKDAGVLKGRITGKTITIEPKGIATHVERSMLHFILASNEDWPVGLDRDDRRIAVFKVDERFADDPAYFDPLYKEIKSHGRAAFLDYLLHYPINDEWLRHPPDTDAKQELKRRSFRPEEAFWFDVLLDGCINGGRCWPATVPKDQLFHLYERATAGARPTGKGWFAKKLQMMCPSLTDGRKNNGPRFWSLPKLEKARLEFDGYSKMKNDWPLDDGDTAPDASLF